MTDQPVRADVVEATVDQAVDPSSPVVNEPTKIIRIASMTRALLDEVRQMELDEDGREQLMGIHDRSIKELRGAFSDDLTAEFDEMFAPLRDADGVPSEAVLRLAQAQLIGWLEGLFHGIQASLMSQQMAAQTQLAEMQQRGLKRPQSDEKDDSSGLYL